MLLGARIHNTSKRKNEPKKFFSVNSNLSLQCTNRDGLGMRKEFRKSGSEWLISYNQDLIRTFEHPDCVLS
jgi:hypothetical protein